MLPAGTFWWQASLRQLQAALQQLQAPFRTLPSDQELLRAAERKGLLASFGPGEDGELGTGVTYLLSSSTGSLGQQRVRG